MAHQHTCEALSIALQKDQRPSISGRYKSFPVEEDRYFLTLLRYVEANPLRAGLVKTAGEWNWSSLGCGKKWAALLLDEWPVERPRGWAGWVDAALTPTVQARIQTSLQRGRPLGGDSWTTAIAKQLGLGYTINCRGRPKAKAAN